MISARFLPLLLPLTLMAAGSMPAIDAPPGASTQASLLSPAGDAPPDFQDPIHVPHGCFLSSVAYLSRFKASFPGEAAETLTVRLRRGDDHTIAIMSWRCEWWGRDEYLGVFPLKLRVLKTGDDQRLRSRAEAALGRHARTHFASQPREVTVGVAVGLTPAERFAHVRAAAEIVPMPSRIVTIDSEGGDLAFLLFSPARGRIAVYDPVQGTACAETGSTDLAWLVPAFAERLGYRVDRVRILIGETMADAELPPLAALKSSG